MIYYFLSEYFIVILVLFRLKYSVSAVADRGLKRSMFTSTRLKKGEVIYVETHYNRYHIRIYSFRYDTMKKVVSIYISISQLGFLDFKSNF